MYNPINTILIDNDPSFLLSMKQDIAFSFPQINLLASEHLSQGSGKLIEQHKPDLLFLDVGRPNFIGIKMIQEYGINPPCEVVLLDNAEGQPWPYHGGAYLDYVHKPVCNKKLSQIIRQFEHKRQLARLSGEIHRLGHLVQSYITPLIDLPTQNGFDMVKIEEIVYCEAQNNYTQIIMNDERKLLVTKTLKEVQWALKPYAFVRVHKSFLIHLHYVTKYVKGEGGQIILKNKKEIPVSRYRKEAFFCACKKIQK